MDQAHDSHSHPHVNYFGVFIALCICTVLSVIFDQIPVPVAVVTLVLAVAVAKALFVMTYFMHLKFEGKWKFIILMPTAILAVGLMFALAPDMAMHYYTNDAPQAKMAEAHGAGGHGHGEHAEEGHGEDAGHDDHGGH